MESNTNASSVGTVNQDSSTVNVNQDSHAFLQPEQTPVSPSLSRPIQDGTYNSSVLPVPQYDKNTSAKLVPLFAYLNGEKSENKESSGPLPVPQDINGESKDTSGASPGVGGALSPLHSLIGAQKSASPASNFPGSDSFSEKPRASDHSLESPHNATTPHRDNQGGVTGSNVLHSSGASLSSDNSGGQSGSVSRNNQTKNDLKDGKIGTQTNSSLLSPTNGVVAGMIVGKNQTKQLPTAERVSMLGSDLTPSTTNKTNLIAQNLGADKSGALIESQAKDPCLNRRENCPSAAGWPQAHKVFPQKQTNSNNKSDQDLAEKKQGNWSTLLGLVKQIQRSHNELETMKALKEKVKTLEVLNNALTTLTSKFLLEKNRGKGSESLVGLSNGKLNAHRHHKLHHKYGLGDVNINQLGSLLNENGGQIVPKREKNAGSIQSSLTSNFMLPKEVDILQKKINKAIEMAEATNRHSVFHYPQKSGASFRHFAENMAKDTDAHGREASDKFKLQNGANNVQIFQDVINQFIKNAEKKGKLGEKSRYPFVNFLRNSTSRFRKFPQDGSRSESKASKYPVSDSGSGFDAFVGRNARESATSENYDVSASRENPGNVAIHPGNSASRQVNTTTHPGISNKHPGVDTQPKNQTRFGTNRVSLGPTNPRSASTLSTTVNSLIRDLKRRHGDEDANATSSLKATNTLITPSRGITLGGRINTETNQNEALEGIEANILKEMGRVLGRRNRTATNSTNLKAQTSESNCKVAPCDSKLSAHDKNLRNEEMTYPFKLKSTNEIEETPTKQKGAPTALSLFGHKEYGTERGVKYHDVSTQGLGKREAAGNDKEELSPQGTADSEEGLEKLIKKLPNDHLQSDLPKSETLPGAPTDKESGETSPGIAMKLLRNIAVQLRKTVYLLDKTKAISSTTNDQRSADQSNPKARRPSDVSVGLRTETTQQRQPFAAAHKTHLVRERLRTQNALGSSTVPHIVEFHSGVTMGKISSFDENEAPDTSVKSDPLVSVANAAKLPQYTTSGQASDASTGGKMEGNSHLPENMNLGGSILTGVDKNESPSTTTSPVVSETTFINKDGLLSSAALDSLRKGTQTGLGLPALDPKEDPGKGTEADLSVAGSSVDSTNASSVTSTAQEGPNQHSMALNTKTSEGKQQSSRNITQNNSEVKELVQGISSLVKLLSGNIKSEENSDEDDGEESQSNARPSETSSENIRVEENDAISQFAAPDTTPDTSTANKNESSENKYDSPTSYDYAPNLNRYGASSSSTRNEGYPQNRYDIDDIGGQYTEYNDGFSDYGNYGNNAYEDRADGDVTDKEFNDKWDYSTEKTTKSSPAWNRSDSYVDSVVNYHPTKNSPLKEEYENLPTEIKDLNDPKLKDDHVLDVVEGIIDKENVEETKQLMRLHTKGYGNSPTKKSKISRGSFPAMIKAVRGKGKKGKHDQTQILQRRIRQT